MALRGNQRRVRGHEFTIAMQVRDVFIYELLCETMSDKAYRLQTIYETGVVLIVRLDSEDEAYQVAEAAIAGGIQAVEIPLSVPRALNLIEKLSARHRHEGVLIGVGTVLDGHTAAAAVNAGAELLVSPNLDPGMIEVANRNNVISMSGAFTPTEMVNTMSAGADIVKLFPAEFVGPAYVKALLAPLAHIPIAPTGGVSLDNLDEWFESGVACVGVGSAITKAARPTGNYCKVTEAAADFVAAVAKVRG